MSGTDHLADIFKDNVRELLRSHSMSQREASDRFEISYKSMRRFCHQGLHRPDKRTRNGLQQLSRHFGLTLDDLWVPAVCENATAPDVENILDNLDRYCAERFIDIPKHHWQVLVEETAKGVEQKRLSSERLAGFVGRYQPPCPLVSHQRRRNDFELFLDFPDDRESTDFVFGDAAVDPVSKWSRLGLRFLNSFGFLENRISGGHRSSPSLSDAWRDLGRRTSVMRAALTLKKHLNEVTAFEAAALKLHVPANFRPTAARSICNDFGNAGTVLDFSAGYGGRFLGFLGSSCSHYIGIDPNSTLKPSYESMFNWIDENHSHNKTWEMIWEPAEDVELSGWKGNVDLVVTSPPYFDLERYSDEPTQSSTRYGTVDEWLERFLFVALRRSVACLKQDGTLALNIADNETYGVEIVSRIIEFVADKLGLTLRQVVPYLLSAKPGMHNGDVGWGRKAEPIFILGRR